MAIIGVSHNTHYGKNGHYGCYGSTIYGCKFDLYGCSWKICSKDTGSLARIDRIRTRFRPKWGHFRVRIWPKWGLIRPRKLRKDWFAHLSCSMILIAPFTGFIPCSYCGYMFVCPILLKQRPLMKSFYHHHHRLYHQ